MLVNGILSPYDGVKADSWKDRTRALVEEHPLCSGEIVEVVTASWKAILNTRVGDKRYRIGVDIFPSPQIMAFFLHELIPLELQSRHPDLWRRDASADEKDVVYIPNDRYCFEVKASSSSANIFGNRSYAQPSLDRKKSKAGYYLAVNFEKFTPTDTKINKKPKITRIRMGWLDHTDWVGQKANTGQQARLTLAARDGKLLDLYPIS